MTLLGTDFDEFFADAVKGLRPYLNQIVCIGGCANALYRFHELAADVKWGFLGTKDADMAVPQKIPPEGRPTIAELMDKTGFDAITCGDANDAVVKYAPSKGNGAADLEFLCDLSGLSRKDQERASILVQEGLYAQPLRYLGMSLQNTWKINLDRIPGFEGLRGIAVQVPNPAAYVVSKVLIRSENRKMASKAKDCFYLFEVSFLFRNALDSISKEYDQLEPIVPKWKKRFEKDARELFASETAEGPISAVDVYRELGHLRSESFDISEEIAFRSVNRMLDAMIDK